MYILTQRELAERESNEPVCTVKSAKAMARGYFSLDSEGAITGINPVAAQIFRLSVDQALGLKLRELISTLNADPNLQPDELHHHPTHKTIRWRGEREDGSSFNLEFDFITLYEEAQEVRGCILTDRESIRPSSDYFYEFRGLMDQAYEAGVSDMALSVLHNVGNTFNTFMISGQLIQVILEKNTDTLLDRAIEEVMDYIRRKDLVHDMSITLIDFLNLIRQRTRQERRELEEEVGNILVHSAKMNNILSDLRASPFTQPPLELVSVPQLIEKVLVSLEPEIRNLNIQVKCDFAPGPRCLLAKAKIMRVVTQILRNSCDALDNEWNRDRPRLLTIKTGNDSDNFWIKIADNGKGIHKDDLIRIFNHGFTRKREGHGLGLHLCANELVEMRGSLKAESNGPGMGAIFTVTIPNKQT